MRDGEPIDMLVLNAATSQLTSPGVPLSCIDGG
jgi:hypothetical protein